MMSSPSGIQTPGQREPALVQPAPGPGSEDLSRLTGAEWLLLLVLAAVQFTHIIDFMIMMPLGPQFMEKTGLNLNPQQFGFLVSAYAFSACLSGLLAAWFIDRFDRKFALLALYAGFGVGTLCCSLAPNYWLLLAARAVTGAFGGVAAACVLAIIGDAIPDERRGRATGIVMLAFSLASILGVPAGLELAERFGWRTPFVALAGLSVPVLLLGYLALPPLRGHLAQKHHAILQQWAVLIQPSLLRAYTLMIMLVLSTFTIVPYLAAYLVANTGRLKTELPYVYLAGGLATLVTMPMIGWIADRLGKLPVFRVCALLTLGAIVVVTNLPPVTLAVALLASTLFMVTSSGRMVPAMALITASAVPRHRGSFLSVNSAVQQLAAGLATLVGGFLLGKTEDGKLTGFPTVGILAVVATSVTIWLAGRLRPAEGGQQALVRLDELATETAGQT